MGGQKARTILGIGPQRLRESLRSASRLRAGREENHGLRTRFSHCSHWKWRGLSGTFGLGWGGW
eukprot:4819521-Pyramimonas_sp.AAC.1